MSGASSKFNPWPWSILGFFVFLISTIVAFVSFALGQNMELVTKDYYAKELRFQQEIDQANNAAAFGDKVGVKFAAASQTVELKVPESLVAAGLKGAVEFYRPSDKTLDFTTPLMPGDDGLQSIDVSQLKPGFWRLSMAWKADGKDYLFRDSIVIEPAPADLQ